MSKVAQVESTASEMIFPLRGQWALAAFGGTMTLIGWLVFLGVAWGWGMSARWALLPSLGLGYIFWFLWRHLEQNHRPHEGLLPTLGWGNIMTLLRAVLLACLAGFLVIPRPLGALAWAPGILYTVAVLADFLDGYLARVTNHATRLGELLDMEFDGWGVLLASLLVVRYEQAPVWYVLVGAARYLYLAGLAWRTRRRLPVRTIPASVSRRLFAGLQMGLSFVLLWPVFTPPGTHWAAALFSLPFLAGFVKDWLVACGRLQPGYGDRRAGLAHFARSWLPAGLRLGALLCGVWIIIRSPGPLGLWTMGVLALLGLGAVPRVAAVLGMMALGFQAFDALVLLQLALYTALLYLGGGWLSLWQPEERFILGRAGEKPNA